MQMQDMKLSPEESAEQGSTVMAEKPDYPYGLKLSLDEESLSKLGLVNPIVGQRIMIQAYADVCCVSAYQDQGSEMEMKADLQITDMAAQKMSGNDVQSKLYGNS